MSIIKMSFKLLISASLLIFPLGHVAATGCYELQLSQLKALTERMNQMMETISSLLPKSLQKLTSGIPLMSTIPPTPAVDYIPRSSGHEIGYYLSPTPYSKPAPQPQVVYVPPYPPVSAIRLPRHSNPTTTPRHYIQAEAIPQPEYSFSAIPSYAPQPPMFNYHHGPPQYISQMTTPQPTPPTFPPGTYSLMQSPHPPAHTHSCPFEYPLPAPTYPNIPSSSPGLPLHSLPMQISNTYFPTYPQISELPQK